MKKEIAAVLVLGILASLGVSGCTWVGRTAGKAQAKLERKANDLEEGYHQGYEGEKRGDESTQPGQPAGEPTPPAGDAL